MKKLTENKKLLILLFVSVPITLFIYSIDKGGGLLSVIYMFIVLPACGIFMNGIKNAENEIRISFRCSLKTFVIYWLVFVALFMYLVFF